MYQNQCEMLRIQPAKSLISVAQMQSAYYSSGLRKQQIIRIRDEQRKLFGRIRYNAAGIRKNSTEKEKQQHNKSINSAAANLKVSTPVKSSEFYWLVQQKINDKNVMIRRSNEVEIAEDFPTEDRFGEFPSNEM